MIANYLKIALRNILRHKGYSVLNIIGLAIGMACCILLVVYIHSEFRFNRYHANYIYTFSAAALLILLIACINFMNMATARSSNRTLEVGIRKVLGAGRRELVVLFFVDALLFSFMAMIVALLLVECTLPLIRSLAGRPLYYNMVEMPWLIPGIIGLTILTGLLSGSYHAFFLSLFQPDKVLRCMLKPGAINSSLRSALVVLQFSIAIVLVAAAAIVISQLNYMKLKAPGFANENIRDILLYFTFLAIFIACLGLFGVASFSPERRTKEIGIRKALGATNADLILLLLKKFIRLGLLANIIAWPMAYLVMNRWLQNFPYRVAIDIRILILAGAITFAVTLLIVSVQVVKAAITNPLGILRQE